MWSQRVGHDWVTSTVGALTHYFMNRRKECCPKFKRSQIFLGEVKTSIFFPCFVHRLHAVEKEIVKAKFQICEVLSNEFLWSFIKVRITGSKTNILFKDLNAYIQNIVKSICWLDLLPIKRTLKSLLLHHSSKVSILWHSAFFTVQLSHPYMTTRKIEFKENTRSLKSERNGCSI